MAANQKDSGCIIQCESKIRLAAGYTRVRVLPEKPRKTGYLVRRNRKNYSGYCR